MILKEDILLAHVCFQGSDAHCGPPMAALARAAAWCQVATMLGTRFLRLVSSPPNVQGWWSWLKLIQLQNVSKCYVFRCVQLFVPSSIPSSKVPCQSFLRFAVFILSFESGNDDDNHHEIIWNQFTRARKRTWKGVKTRGKNMKKLVNYSFIFIHVCKLERSWKALYGIIWHYMAL